MLVDEATEYKKSFFLKKKNEQVEHIIDWIKALKARHEIQVKIIRCDIGSFPELGFFCIYLHYISFALHLHFIYILHSSQNRYICITFH